MSTPLAFEGLSNVRDLGGMRTEEGRALRMGKLFRSDQLFSATQADREALDAMNIRVVIDFRSGIEREEKPDPELDGATNLHLPIIKDVRAGITRDKQSTRDIMKMIMSGQGADPAVIDAYMANMYREFVTEPYANEQYARFVDAVMEALRAGGSAMWHCTAGKDRAGFATAILLEALGVARDDIMADYLQTNECLAGVTKQLVGVLSSQVFSSGLVQQFDEHMIETMKAALDHFFRADESFLASAYAAAEEQFGSFDAFLAQGLGVDDAKREELCRLCLS